MSANKCNAIRAGPNLGYDNFPYLINLELEGKNDNIFHTFVVEDN